MQVNFATRSWIKIGAKAKSCECHSDNVTLDMSLFLDAAHPRDRKFLRDCLPAPTSSDSDSSSESGSDVESCSQHDDAESDNSTAELEPSRPGRGKRAASPSSQDSASPPPSAKRRHIQPAIRNLQDPPSCHVMHPSSKPAGLQKSAPVKRGPGRPRKDASIKPTPGVRKQSGSASRSETTYRRVASDKTRASRGLRSIRGQSAASLDDLSRAARLAQRRRRQHLQESACKPQQARQHKSLAQRQAKVASESKQPTPAVLQKGYGSGSNESHQHVSFVPAKAASPRGNLKHSRPQIVRSPFSFASQALKSAAQLLSLRPRKISVPVCRGTRGKLAQKS